MKIAIHQVDAFTDRVFGGNPAAVCPLDAWLDDATLRAIAAENNLSETAFFVEEPSGFRIRWFTPTTEVDLCGHATLASAWVLFHALALPGDVVRFESRSGPLAVHRKGDFLELDFPSLPAEPGEVSREELDALGEHPEAILVRSRLMVAIYAHEAQVRALAPELAVYRRLDRKVLITAPGRDVDFVSRFFAPSFGIDEDPVTGSAHCTLVPYWAARLGKTVLRARQVSARGGELLCTLRGDRVGIAGKAVRYLEGTIEVPAT